MNTYVLYGGRSPLSNSFLIEDEIVKSCKKEDIKALFVPFAKEDSTQSFNSFKEQFKNYNLIFNCLNLDDLKNNNYKELFKDSDILYFAGGSAKALIEIANEYNFKEILSLLKNKVIVGISAGGIMLALKGLGDGVAYYDNFSFHNNQMLKGISLLNCCFCPHYEKQGLEIFNDLVKNEPVDSFAVSTDTAVFIKNDSFYSIKNKKDEEIYFISKDLDYKLIDIKENNLYKWR